jgi:hypothetical protein
MIESLKNLPLLQAQTQPLSSASQSFYANTFASGTGPQGTFTITDFLGTAIGVTVGPIFKSTADLISSLTTAGSLADLIEIYDVMIGCFQGLYPDPLNPPDGIDIPAPLPGAGIYADLDSAITALVALANAEITSLGTSLGANATALNSNWNSIVNRVVYEATNQSKASLQMYALIPGDKMSVMALVTGLNGIGNETDLNGPAQFFEEIADTAGLPGQAIIGALREGRNDTALNSQGLGHDNAVLPTPSVIPPPAPLLNSEYTVAEARAFNRFRIFNRP